MQDVAVTNIAALQGEDTGKYLRALLALSEGDAATARSLLQGLVADDDARRWRMRAMQGWASILEGDSVVGIEQMRSATDSMPPATLGGRQIDNVLRFALARTLAARADTRDEGIRALRYGFDPRAAPAVYGMRLLALAAALENSGDYEGAAVVLSDFLDTWQNAHPSLQGTRDAARRDLERVNARAN